MAMKNTLREFWRWGLDTDFFLCYGGWLVGSVFVYIVFAHAHGWWPYG